MCFFYHGPALQEDLIKFVVSTDHIVIAPSFDQPWNVRRGIQSQLEPLLFAHHQNCLEKRIKKLK